MLETTIEIQNSAQETIRDLLGRLMASGAVDALLLPVAQPGGAVTPTLVSNPAALERAEPLAPVLPINAARAVSQLTMTGHRGKLGVVLRACEIRALVELVKFQQAKLDDVLVVGIDCLGTYPVPAYQAVEDKAGLLDQLLAGAVAGEVGPAKGLALRSACQICELPLPQGEHVALTVGLLGVEAGKLYLKARDDVAQALALAADGVPARRAEAAKALLAARTQARDEVFAAFRARVGGQGDMQGLLAEFSTCIRCHNCMTNCPICYCRECIFRTPTFEHESELYYQWAERKGEVRLLPDTLLFHLTRLNHMVSSCVGCGVCSDVCPVDIEVMVAFRATGEKVQALFDYHPGRSLAEEAPVQTFREDELTAMGERPHA